MKQGLYDQVIDLFLEQEFADNKGQLIFGREGLDPVDSHDYLAQHLHLVLVKALSQVKHDRSFKKDKEKAQSKLINQITLSDHPLQ